MFDRSYWFDVMCACFATLFGYACFNENNQNKEYSVIVVLSAHTNSQLITNKFAVTRKEGVQPTEAKQTKQGTQDKKQTKMG